MISLDKLKISDIMPERLTTKEILAITNALDIEMMEITEAIKEAIILPLINEMSEDIIDNLAWQFHVDFYDINFDLETKRKLVKNSLDWHRRKGTPSAVREVVSAIFGESIVEEWFEYGGEPYFFRITVKDPYITETQFSEITRAVNSVKNARSWLEGIMLRHEFNAEDYHAGATADAWTEHFIEEIEVLTEVSYYHVGATIDALKEYFIEETELTTEATDYYLSLAMDTWKENFIEEVALVTDKTDYYAGIAYDQMKEAFEE